MQKSIPTLLLVALLFTACNLPVSPSNAAKPEDIATRVSQLMTQNPAVTPALVTATGSASQNTPLPATSTPSANATIEATTTLQATQTVQAGPTATLPPGDPKKSLGQPAWQATSDTSKSFYLYENEGTLVKDDNGLLSLTGKINNGWLGWSMTHSHPAQNFYLEAAFKTQDCGGADSYGVVFRAPSDQAGYFFSVTCDGKYSLEARDFTNNNDNTLVKLTPNGAIQPGANQTNRLGVLANSDKLSLYANGILLQTLTDTTFNPEKGFLGVQIAANLTTGFTVTLQEISLWTNP